MSMGPKKLKRRPFRRYGNYVDRLKKLAKELHRGPAWDEQVAYALDGEASTELRRVAALKIRRKHGAYFTGTRLSKCLVKKCTCFDANCIFYDPTVGMGDLLIAAAKNLPLARTLHGTLLQWGQQLTGTDLHPEFIAGAQTRLMLLARQRHQSFDVLPDPPAKFFPNIRIADGLVEKKAFERATTLLLNPPFGLVKAPKACGWAGGRVSEAATFVITALERSRAGTELLAILPEVLRSGAFSEQWRNRVGELAEVHLVKPYGIFDETADIDVFLLRLIRRSEKEQARKKKWPIARVTKSTTVADHFGVHVGRVVPHRDKKTGPEHPYIHPRCVPTWEVMKTFSEKRKHNGLVYNAPFVAIRRTSRPGHPYRATATVIAGARPVAVENHLIVCEPKDGKLATCKKLMQHLQSETVNHFLNARIRCRHLTVGVVEAIPFRLLTGPAKQKV